MQLSKILTLMQAQLSSLELPHLGLSARLDECTCGKQIIVVSAGGVGGVVVFHEPLELLTDDVVKDQIKMFDHSLVEGLVRQGLLPTDRTLLVPEWTPAKITWLNTPVAPSSYELMRAFELAAMPVNQINAQKLANLKTRAKYPAVLYSHLAALLNNVAVGAL